VYNVQRSTAGLYVCTADNGVQHPVSRTITVTVRCQLLTLHFTALYLLDSIHLHWIHTAVIIGPLFNTIEKHNWHYYVKNCNLMYILVEPVKIWSISEVWACLQNPKPSAWHHWWMAWSQRHICELNVDCLYRRTANYTSGLILRCVVVLISVWMLTVGPVIDVASELVYTGPGQSLTIECIVESLPKASVTWYHNSSSSALDFSQRSNVNSGQWFMDITCLTIFFFMYMLVLHLSSCDAMTVSVLFVNHA